MNQLTIMGNVGREPELRYTQSGTAVCDFSVATNRRWKDRTTGENREETSWFRCTAWGAQAEVINQHVKKGQKLLVQGRASSSAWIDQQGEARSTTELTIERWEFAGGGRPNGEASEEAGESEEIPFN